MRQSVVSGRDQTNCRMSRNSYIKKIEQTIKRHQDVMSHKKKNNTSEHLRSFDASRWDASEADNERKTKRETKGMEDQSDDDHHDLCRFQSC
jgi:hypothetical protein